MKPAWRIQARFTALILIFAAACNALPGIGLGPFAAKTPAAGPSATPDIQITLIPQATSAPSPRATTRPTELTLWLPPEFDPTADNTAARLLKARLDSFSQNNGIQINVRIKSSGGPASLLESLSAASAAAPQALPSVTALSRSDMETAAVKGLLVPLDGLTKVFDGTDWYDYARQLSKVQGNTFGLPFAGDALLVAYRPSAINPAPSSWDGILSLNQNFAFAAASQQALATIGLYISAGGELSDAQNRPLLQADRLLPVFTLYREAAQKGVFSSSLAQYETDAQVWQAYQEGHINACLAWTSSYLSDRPNETTIVPMPAPSGGSFSLSTGWSWTITDPNPETQNISMRLAEWLSDSEFLGNWSEAAGYLPTRPSALGSWRDNSLKAVLSQVALSARARPTNDLLSSLGPVLREAVLSVIRLESEPQAAAKAAADRVASPPSP